MALYDNTSKDLCFKRITFDGQDTLSTEPVRVSLKDLTELERQVVVSAAKVALNFAKQHDLHHVPTLNDGTEGQSSIGKLLKAIERLKSSHDCPPVKDE